MQAKYMFKRTNTGSFESKAISIIAIDQSS